MKKRILFVLQVTLTFLVPVFFGRISWDTCLYDYAGYLLPILVPSHEKIALSVAVAVRLLISYGFCSLLHRHPVICIVLDLLWTALIIFVNVLLFSR